MELETSGVKVYYQIFGQGTPLLLLHGWGSNSERWQVVAEELAKEYKVIVPDMPGFGRSDALSYPWKMNNYVKWIEDFVKALGLKEYYLMGHSFGGALAAKLAINHPQEVRKLFLVSSASVRKKTAKKTIFKNLSKIAKLFDSIPGYNFFRKAFYKFIIRNSDYPYVDLSMIETYKNVIAEDLSQFTGFIKVPTVIIWGDKDTYTPIEDARFMEQKIHGSKLIIIPGAGHILNREYPEVLAKKILENIA